MKKLLLALFIGLLSLQATTILTYKVYERTNRVDVLITFDTPYTGRISQKEVNHIINLSLHDASYDKKSVKTLDSKFINSFSITSASNLTMIKLDIPKDAQYSVSKTIDNYGLRLRFTHKKASLPTLKESTALAPISKTKIETKDTSGISSQYLIVIGFMFIAVLGLYFVKRKMQNSQGGNSWLFKNKLAQQNDFEILFQKPLDQNNRVVMLKIASKQYLAIIGNTNILLDKFGEIDDSMTQDGFENVLQKNKQELDKYMQIKKEPESHDPLQSYKDKASLDIYKSQV